MLQSTEMFLVLLQLENETPSFTKTLLRLRAGRRSYEKYDSCNNLVLMRMALRLLNVCTQSPAAVLAPSSLLIYSPFVSPKMSSFIQLLHLRFPRRCRAGSAWGPVYNRKWVQNATDCHWLVDGVYGSCVGYSCMNSCTLGSHDICVYQLRRGLDFSLPSTHAVIPLLFMPPLHTVR